MTIELLAEVEILRKKIERYEKVFDKYEKAFDKIITDLADYRDNPILQKADGWDNTFYDGIEYAVDVINEVKENVENADSN